MIFVTKWKEETPQKLSGKDNPTLQAQMTGKVSFLPLREGLALIFLQEFYNGIFEIKSFFYEAAILFENGYVLGLLHFGQIF